MSNEIHLINFFEHVMSFNCSKCNFKANFESALEMHKQLHHDNSGCTRPPTHPSKPPNNFSTIPRETQKEQIFPIKPRKSLRSLARSSSATRLLDKIRVRLCRSKLLFPHPEETAEEQTSEDVQNKPLLKILEVKHDAVLNEMTEISRKDKSSESFGCHLCSLEADRITVLDRHLLNDHKIGMDNLLKLVMDKTKDGLTDDIFKHYGERKSYYKPLDEIVTETRIHNVKSFKNAASNTDLKWTDIPHLDDCRSTTKEIEDVFDVSSAGNENRDVFEKMRTLNECMSKFLSSSKTLNRVLSKELSHKVISRTNERVSRLGLGDQETRARYVCEGFERDQQDTRFSILYDRNT